MDEHSAGKWGDQFADVCDDLPLARGRDDVDLCVSALSELAGEKGSALELGIGSGRIALPLALRGCRVSGIEGSMRMLEKLRSKPGSDPIKVSLGNFADVAAEGPFDLIYVVHNTFTCLTSQSEQLKCFCNAGRNLTARGSFVVETFVPWRKPLANGFFYEIGAMTSASVTVTLVRANLEEQLLDTQLVMIDGGGAKLFPARYRYVWPSELDLMAEVAGLRLYERWSNWERSAFTSESNSQIAVYTRR